MDPSAKPKQLQRRCTCAHLYKEEENSNNYENKPLQLPHRSFKCSGDEDLLSLFNLLCQLTYTIKGLRSRQETFMKKAFTHIGTSWTL